MAGARSAASLLTALIIFGLSYLAIAGQSLPFVKLDRPSAALLGAVAMVALGVVPLDTAYRAIDLDVILLLLGVMLIAGYLTEARFFRFTAWWVLTRARTARSLLWGLVLVAGAMSALLVNDTVCLMLTPLVLTVAVEAELPPLPYLLGLTTASNVGGVVSFTGNPQNMIVAGAAADRIGYLDYLVRALPLGVVCLVVDAALLVWLFRRQLPAGRLQDRAPPRPYLDRKLAGKSLGALAVFVVLASLGVSLAGAAITAAALLTVVAEVPARTVLARLDWPLLLFFAGLFVIVGGVAHTGALELAAGWMAPALQAGGLASELVFTGATVVGSNLVSNVPYVLVAVHWVERLEDPAFGYALLAVASTLAGNLTIVGSVANVIVLELAGPRGDIGFWRFLRYGAPITIATLVVSLAILLLERALGLW